MSVSEVVLHVCTTCRGVETEGPRPGAQLLDAVERRLVEAPRQGLRVEGVQCLSACKRPCAVAVSSAGRWTYVYGDLDPETSAATILEGLDLYAATPDGLVPWSIRPEAFRKGVVARIPPSAPAGAIPEAAE